MSLNPNATATVLITGLALCRKKNNNWEVLFIHPQNTEHILKVGITRINLSNGEEQTILEETQIVPRGKITITTENARRPANIEYNNGNFGDEHDFCWTINLNNLHPEGFTLKTDQYMRTSHLSISDSVFYTTKRTRKIFRIQQQGNPRPREKRRIGDVIGADIECLDGGRISFQVQGLEPIILPRENGFKYLIYLANTCETDTCRREIDFKYYYDFITPGSGNPFDLEEDRKSIINDEAACNPAPGDPGCDLERYFQTGSCS